MIVKDEDALKRLNSPLNLINQLKNISSGKNMRKDAMQLFIPHERQVISSESSKHKSNGYSVNDGVAHPSKNTFSEKLTNPFKPQSSPPVEIPATKLDEILENNEAQIKLGLAHDKALDLLTNSVSLLANKLDEVSANKLPTVIGAASKVVESIRRERTEAIKNGRDKEVHFHFYTPQQKRVEDYEIIDVVSSAS